MVAATGTKTKKKKEDRKRSPHAYRQCAYCGECEQDALYQWLDWSGKTSCFNCLHYFLGHHFCPLCGNDGLLEEHHIAGRFASDDPSNAPGVSEIVAVICRNCHKILTRGFKHHRRKRLLWRPPIPLYVALHVIGILELWHVWALRRGYIYGFPKIDSRPEALQG